MVTSQCRTNNCWRATGLQYYMLQADRPRYARLTTSTRACGPRLYSNIKLYANSPHSLVHLLQIQLIVRKYSYRHYFHGIKICVFRSKFEISIPYYPVAVFLKCAVKNNSIVELIQIDWMLEITLAQSNDSLRESFYYAQLTTDRDTEINLY